MDIGDVCNAQGDILIFGKPVMEGRFALPVEQAIRALYHGWKWKHEYDLIDDVLWIMVQRGGERWVVRR